ncbi:hypothetical protein D3C71_1921240 [compost metagenome]
MVVIVPTLIPKASCSAFAIGARQLVVQEATEIMVSLASIVSSLTLKTMVFISPAGAEMSTFFAPASRWALDFSSEV